MPFHGGADFSQLSAELSAPSEKIGTLADARIALHFP
jgi:hypothetical protein